MVCDYISIKLFKKRKKKVLFGSHTMKEERGRTEGKLEDPSKQKTV